MSSSSLNARIVALALGFALWSSASGSPARVTGIRWGRHEGFSRCVIEFEGAAARATLENRIADFRVLYCDLWGTQCSVPTGVRWVDDPYVQALHTLFVSSENRVRLAIKIDRWARPQVGTLDNPGRIVIDLYWTGEKVAAAPAGPAFALSGYGTQTAAAVQVTPSVAAPKASDGGSAAAAPLATPKPAARERPRHPVIVLDPGHGGWHKGAVEKVGGRTVYEKDITLEIARRVKRRLEALGRYDVRLTRTSDVYVGLVERAEKAQALNGDLFVSIHCNSVDGRQASRRVRGLELWYWNKNGCSSAADQYLERLENEEDSDAQLGDVTPSTRKLITSMMADQLEAMALRSADACGILRGSFTKIGYFRDNFRGIKSARFKVLEIYQMPAILVETGFLSHPEESRRLVSDEFQETIAKCLVEGIDRVMRKLGE